MSISAIYSSAYSAYVAPSRQLEPAAGVASSSATTGATTGKTSGTATNPTTNPTKGPDRVSFSEEARMLAQNSAARATSRDADAAAPQTPDSAQNASDRTSLTALGKSSLLSLLLENLFFAELEENAAHSQGADQSAQTQNGEGGGTQGGEQTVQRQQRATAARPLEDSGKVAEIKKMLNDVATGKTDLSDLPKVMAGSGATRPKAGTANSETPLTARPAAEGAQPAAS